MNVDQAVTEVLRFEPKTLFGSKGAVDEDGCDIAEQIRIGTPWLLTALYCKPETVITWHRKGFRLFWTWKVRHGQPGRPSVPKDVRDLIRLMSRANPTMLVRENLSKAISVQPAALSLRWYTQPRLRKGSK